MSSSGIRLTARVCAFALACLATAVGASAEERFQKPSDGDVLSAGETAMASWSAPCDDSDADEAELVLSLDGGITFPVRITRSLPACTGSFSWRVPDVATAEGRLGVRQGREGRPETERIVLVSGRFSILSTGDAHGADLTRGAIEWWTDEALFDVAAEDWLGFGLNRPTTWKPGAASEAAVDAPGPESSSSRNPDRERLRARSSRARSGDAGPSLVRRTAPVPLRV